MSDRLDIQLDGFDATMSRAVQHLTIDDVDDLAEAYLNQRSRIAALEAQVTAGAVLAEAARLSHEGWCNILELELIREQHRPTTEKLRDDLHQKLAAWKATQ